MKIFSALILLISVSACATGTDFDFLRRDVSELKKENIELKKESLESKKEIGILKERNSGNVKEESFSAVRESQADITSRLSGISSDIQELRGRFEENKYYMEKTIKDSLTEKDLLKIQITDLEVQMKNLKERLTILEETARTREMERAKEKERAKEAAKKAEQTKPEVEKTTAPPEMEPDRDGQTKPEVSAQEQLPDKRETADDRTRAYVTAYQAFKDKKFKEARDKFEAFIKDHPRNSLTGNAQFWIAETYYAEKDYESAILAYETLLKKYPDSEKTASALLKQGFAFIEIGDAKTGKTILLKLIEKFPDSKEASLAKKKISEIEKKPVKKRSQEGDRPIGKKR